MTARQTSTARDRVPGSRSGGTLVQSPAGLSGARGPAGRGLPVAAALLVLAALGTGCPGGPERVSPAADEYIAAAETDEEREALEEARDEIDREMAAAAAEKDAEIERLREENEELRRQLAARQR